MLSIMEDITYNQNVSVMFFMTCKITSSDILKMFYRLQFYAIKSKNIIHM